VPDGKVDTTKPGCESITPTIYTGGKPDLGPEESKQWTAGFVWEPMDGFSLSVDWWSIRKTGTIQSLALADLVANYALFPDNFMRDAAGNLVAIDTRWVNAGETMTKGIDINARGGNGRRAGPLGVVLDGSYLLEKKSRLIASAPFGASEVGVFTPRRRPRPALEAQPDRHLHAQAPGPARCSTCTAAATTTTCCPAWPTAAWCRRTGTPRSRPTSCGTPAWPTPASRT
jgi:hypothetical protein